MVESSDLDGRVAVVTGAGAGLGRAEALGLAARGAAVVVNDLSAAAHDVVGEITAAGGRAVALTGDVGDWSLGGRLVDAAVRNFGALDILVNNAGITRDAMHFNLSEADWDDVIRVHLKGHAGTSRAAAAHWRQVSKAESAPTYGRIINTSSEAFLFGPPGQPNYAAAKAGITALTLSCAQGLARYGVRANAICPRARTTMTSDAFASSAGAGTSEDPLSPGHVATLVNYLASPASDEVNGQVFVVYGRMVALMAAPTVRERFDAAGAGFTEGELADQLTRYFRGRDTRQTYAALDVATLETHALGTTAGARL